MPDRKPAFLRRPKFTRVDLVDRGANQDADIVFFKRSDDDDKGVNHTPTDTDPKTQDPPKGFVAKVIEAVAKMMGRKAMTMDQVMVQREKEREIYDKEWQFQSAFRESVESIMGDAEMDTEKRKLMLRETMEQYHQKMVDHMKAMIEMMESNGNSATLPDKGGDSMYKAQDPDPNAASGTDVKKKDGEEKVPTIEDVKKALTPELSAVLDAVLAKGQPAKVEIPEEITKRLSALEETAGQVSELKKRAETAEGDLKQAREDLAKEREIRVQREFLEKAKKYPSAGAVEKVADILRKAYGLSDEYGKEIEETMAKTEAMASHAALFEEHGRSGLAKATSAEEEIEKLALERVTKGLSKTKEQAYAEVLQIRPDLYTRSLEKGGN